MIRTPHRKDTVTDPPTRTSDAGHSDRSQAGTAAGPDSADPASSSSTSVDPARTIATSSSSTPDGTTPSSASSVDPTTSSAAPGGLEPGRSASSSPASISPAPISTASAGTASASPASPTEANPIEARITTAFADLTAQERRAATTILEHLDDLAAYSSADLSALSGVSRPTLSRLYRQLGYRSFAEMRNEARHAGGVPIGPSQGVESHVSQETRNITKLGRLADGRLQAAATSIMGASDLVIIGYRNSYPVAMHLREQLVQLRPGSRLLPLPGQTVAEDMVGVGPGDTVILVGLRRRTDGFDALLRLCVASRADVVLIADNSALRYADQVTHFLPCSLDSSGPFSSYAAAMSLVAMIANQASAIAGPQGGRRVSMITDGYQQLDELEHP